MDGETQSFRCPACHRPYKTEQNEFEVWAKKGRPFCDNHCRAGLTVEAAKQLPLDRLRSEWAWVAGFRLETSCDEVLLERMGVVPYAKWHLTDSAGKPLTDERSKYRFIHRRYKSGSFWVRQDETAGSDLIKMIRLLTTV